MRKALTQSASAALTQPQAISGLGGIGKTQTAIEYAHLYRAEYPAVLWSGADSRDALRSGFATFANLLNLPQKDEQGLGDVAAAVRRWPVYLKTIARAFPCYPAPGRSFSR